MKEIEIKVQVESDKKLLEFLAKEAKIVKEEHQIDEYYSPKEKSFIDVDPVKEWLRLRAEGDKSSINYKYWHYNSDGKCTYCDEHETKIDNAEEMSKILKALNNEPIITVDKIRKSYLYKNYEISVDEVKDLGHFIEIELKSTEEVDPEKTTDEMMKFLERFETGKIERDYKGYPKLLLEKIKAK